MICLNPNRIIRLLENNELSLDLENGFEI
jgi:hypothetical protein